MRSEMGLQNRERWGRVPIENLEKLNWNLKKAKIKIKSRPFLILGKYEYKHIDVYIKNSKCELMRTVRDSLHEPEFRTSNNFGVEGPIFFFKNKTASATPVENYTW